MALLLRHEKCLPLSALSAYVLIFSHKGSHVVCYVVVFLLSCTAKVIWNKSVVISIIYPLTVLEARRRGRATRRD